MGKERLEQAFNEALSLDKEGASSEALQAYLDIIEKQPRFKQALLNAGSLYARMSRLEAAIDLYEKALRVSTDYITYFNLGAIYYKLADYKQAVIYLEKSTGLNSAFYLSNLVMALSYSQLKNTKAAEVNFRKVLKQKPKHVVALTALCIICYNTKRFDEALALMSALTGESKNMSRLKNIKFNILYEKGEIDKSLEEIKQIKNETQSFIFYDEYIQSIPVTVYNDKYGSIEEKIEKLEDKKGESSEDLISLSLCHLLKGNTDQAMDCLFKARKLSKTG